MVRKRLDDRVRFLLERSVATGQRSLLVLVGDHGKDQVPNLHQILSKCCLRERPKVLWCYKKELGFSTHRLKRMKKLKRDKARGLTSVNSSGNNNNDAATTADNFELFISQTDITWCYYKDSHRVLGTTVNLLVLQDFEALTPNLLARTIETVAGGGLVVFLLRTVTSLRQLYAMTMDVHARYRTESAGDVVPRFNERFLLSLGACPNCLVCDDELNVLPLSRRSLASLGPADSSSSNSSNNSRGDAGEVLVPATPEQRELRDLQESLLDTPHVGALTALTKTLDQAQAVLTFLEACAERSTTTPHSSRRTTVTLTAPRGRGKSAALGLCLAGAVALGYSTILVTAPAPENLVSVFDFVVRGLEALHYREHADYTVARNAARGRDETKGVTAVCVHREHRQVIRYVPPDQIDQFSGAEIVAIDEAAAIPLPAVRALLHQQPDRLVFLSSTVNGYEGTGRALRLKLIQELRDAKGGGGSRRADEPHTAATAAATARTAAAKTAGKRDAQVHEQRYAAAAAAVQAGNGSSSNSGADRRLGPLREMELATPIRYALGDPVEAWLNQLLCLDSGGTGAHLHLAGGAPAPAECELYSVNRDALFSYHKLSEAFLQKVMGLYTSAHYKNSPNDLQLLSDAPAHALFVLLSPSAERDARHALPDVLAVVQVALEGKISRRAVEAQLARGHRSAGDLIPWTLAQQFGDATFAQLSGARVVRVAVHPAVQGMGYGTRAVELLYRFYNGEMISLANGPDDRDGEDDDDGNDDSDNDANKGGDDPDDEYDDAAVSGDGLRGETLKPRKELPPLLLPLTEVATPRLDWLGTSFGLTLPLHKFWTRCGMRLLYVRQTQNELTGEHSAIMVRALPRRTGVDDAWLAAFMVDTRRRLVTLLGGSFRTIDIRLALSALEHLATAAGGAAPPGRAGPTAGLISTDELELFLTPHDLKRLELYGRNLCDHHLVTDLLPIVARLYFLGRFGPELNLSSVQAALLCGVGLQNKTVDGLTSELGLPSNQVLAMFNKAVRKLSIALNAIVETKEKQSMLGGEQRRKAEQAVAKMRDVAELTLEDDAKAAAKSALEALRAADEIATLPPEIADDHELMRYVVKGSKDQWDRALGSQNPDHEAGAGTATVQIQSTREKRKALNEEEMMREAANDKGALERAGGGGSSNKKKKKSKSPNKRTGRR